LGAHQSKIKSEEQNAEEDDGGGECQIKIGHGFPRWLKEPDKKCQAGTSHDGKKYRPRPGVFVFNFCAHVFPPKFLLFSGFLLLTRALLTRRFQEQ